MAIKHFCDRCGNEVQVGEKTFVHVTFDVPAGAVKPRGENFDLCRGCLHDFTMSLQLRYPRDETAFVSRTQPTTGE